MKKTVRNNVLNLPYSLHDARVNQLQVEGNKVTILFDKGFYVPKDGDCLLTKGYITLEKVDLDFCKVYLFEGVGENGEFTGKRYELVEFISKYPTFDFEIVDETYGYNMSKFMGYVYEGACGIKECIVEFYHFGPMTYLSEG